MIELKELNEKLNDLLKPNEITDYGLNGLQVEGKPVIRSVGVAVTASIKAIELAIDKGVDALIVHHGIFWKGNAMGITGSLKKKIALLLLNEVSLFAYHLPLDKHPTVGNNWKAALDLGWDELEPFGEVNGAFIGVRGRIAKESRDSVKKKLEEYYQHPAVCAFGGKNKIETIALISGGAHKSISEATKKGIDAFVTGSFDEPIWHHAFEDPINFLALGHFATERIGPKALCNYIREIYGVPCHFLDEENPF